MKDPKDVVFYKNVPVVCQDRHGNLYFGDVPGVRFNPITEKFEEIVNPRGKAYAARVRIKHRKKRKD